MKTKLFLLSLFSAPFLLSSLDALAAACCGGGFGTATVISGDDKAQFTGSYSANKIIVDSVNSKGIWKTSNSYQLTETYKIDAAHILSDRWQAGLSIPIIKRSKFANTYSGIGDISLTTGYEYLPDWNYNPLRPKGIGYAQLILPTGKSKLESEIGGLDSRGNGFLALSLGTILTKNIENWDLFTDIEFHRSFAKSINTSQLNGNLKPGNGSKLGLGGGFNLKDYRIGTSITWNQEDSIYFEGDMPNTISNEERFATASLNCSYLKSDSWVLTASYSDQTIFGTPINTSLSQGISIQIQRKWER